MESNEKQVIFTYKPDFDYNSLDASLFTPRVITNELAPKKVEDDFRYFKFVTKSLFSKKQFVFLFTSFVLFILLILLVPLIASRSKTFPDSESKFSFQHIFGLDQNDRDFFVNICFCTETSLKLSFYLIFFQIFFGFLIGIIWSYFLSANNFFKKITKTISLIPIIFWCILVVFLFKISGKIVEDWHVIFCYSLVSWSRVSIDVKKHISSESNIKIYNASKVLGTKSWRIFYKNIVPNLLPIIFKTIYVAIPETIFLEVTFDYIDFGFNPDYLSQIDSLGQLLSSAFMGDYWENNIWLIVIPTMWISLMLLIFFYTFRTISKAFELKIKQNY